MNTEDFSNVVKQTVILCSKGLFNGDREQNTLLLEQINNIRLAYRQYKSSVSDASLHPRYFESAENAEQFNLRKESLGNVVQELDNFSINIFEFEGWNEAKKYVETPALVKYKEINITELVNIK